MNPCGVRIRERGGGPPPTGRLGGRTRSVASSVSGSSKKSNSMSLSRSVMRIQPKPGSLYPVTRPGKDLSAVRPTHPEPVQNAAAAPLQSELVLGRYRPLRPLGTGGTGSVWLSRDEQNGLDVALKIVPREGKAGARAEREAEAAARLRHPSCQRAYGFGRDSQHVYIAYEYTPGRTFREALRSGDLDDATAIESAVQMLEGLAHAHARGIVHRDVKPSNVLLADGDRVSVRLLDFGLARLPQAETLTAVGDVPGTLAYISPERLGGAAATPAADVWAVGVLLWDALAIPVLPLGNLALGAALLYVAVAVALLAFSWREPESGLLAALGPLLAPLSALGLLPLLTLRTRSAARRALQAGAAVLAAGVVAGVRHAPLPFDGAAAPHDLGLAGSRSLTATASVLWQALLSRPALVVETLVLAIAAALLPYVRERGLWAIAGLGAAMLAAAVLPVPDVAAIPLVVSVWATCAVTALR